MTFDLSNSASTCDVRGWGALKLWWSSQQAGALLRLEFVSLGAWTIVLCLSFLCGILDRVPHLCPTNNLTLLKIICGTGIHLLQIACDSQSVFF